MSYAIQNVFVGLLLQTSVCLDPWTTCESRMRFNMSVVVCVVHGVFFIRCKHKDRETCHLENNGEIEGAFALFPWSSPSQEFLCRVFAEFSDDDHDDEDGRSMKEVSMLWRHRSRSLVCSYPSAEPADFVTNDEVDVASRHFSNLESRCEAPESMGQPVQLWKT